MGRPKISAKMSEELKDSIIAFYQVPNTVEQTLKYFSISKTALKQILADRAVPRHDKQTQARLGAAKNATILTTEQVQQAIYLYKQGKSIRSIAMQFLISDRKILDIFKAEQVNIRTHEEQVFFGREAAKHTNLLRYGAENPSATAEIKEKTKQTNLARYGRTNVGQFGTDEHKLAIKEKYGVEYIAQNPIIQEKIAATCIERYGGIGFASDELNKKAKDTCEKLYGDSKYLNRQKIEQTCLEKYHGLGAASSKIYEKIKQTNLDKYGVICTLHADSIKNKVKQVNLEKYGTEFPTQNEAVKQKTKATGLKLWGVEYFAQSAAAANIRRSLFVFNNEHFDSLPELAFYLYYIKSNIAIKRRPAKIKYVYENDSHYYFPDFEVDGLLFEIKGDHFLKEDGTWRCPFNPAKDELYEAKHQCAIKNNVTILYKKDYQKYVDWFYEQGFKKEDFLDKK